ncbi:MAG: sugar transferase [Candidatus Paraimprobicoccus trichonymphae]|uniref:Sugar transferase n=1 Tax=Candidatus Paraimprobicoccus trichonymphae TaxID=3033793 RepID=A0AA48KZ14_9FIRM|nr:MAG: sugar transferase [Candidatus Paraimprobicoccus trichonymphae]
MILKNWDELPDQFKNQEVLYYYNILKNKKINLIIKRLFDIFCSGISIIVFLPVFFVIYLIIKLDSPKEKVIFKQERITQYKKTFKILKFRTMKTNSEKIQITCYNDPRITKIGKFLRKYKLDEIPQIFNIFSGNMTFVGTRPEVEKYINYYTNEMLATLLLPAGATSEASLEFQHEEKNLKKTENINLENLYLNDILPEKMKINLKYIKKMNFFYDVKIILKSFIVFKYGK